MAGALEHLRVLDLSRVLAGPWATQILADLGAEVVKIERPGVGDDTRAWGPPFLEDAAGRPTGDSAYFLSANRGKKSLTVDLSTAEGQDIVRALARTSDVLVENYKLGTLGRYGLGYEDLRALNPRLIYCSITGFGQSGPYAHLPGYDFVFQGMSGLMSVTGQPEGAPGDEPMKMGVAIVDILTGMYAVAAVLAAVEHRREGGEGQHIDLALMDCATAATANQALNYLVSGEAPRRMGNAHANLTPYQVFRCLDGEVIVAVGNDRQFAAYAQVVERPELATDPLYLNMAGRNRNRATLLPLLAGIMRTRPAADWLERMEAADVPCGPVNTLEQVFQDPQVEHRGMLRRLPHGAGVEVPTVASPLRLSRTPAVHDRAPPLLGEHTHEVLRERLQLPEEAIAGLRARGVV